MENINSLFHGLSFIVFIFLAVGYSMTISALAHEKNRASCQMNILLLLPIAILAFYLINLPLHRLLANTIVPVDTSSWYSLAAVNIAAGLILAGDTQERIKVSALCLLTICIGLVSTVAHLLTVSTNGWLVTALGFSDNFAAGALHTVAGGFLLGVLLVLRARLYRLHKSPDQRLKSIIPHNNPGGAFTGLVLLVPATIGMKLLFLRLNSDMELVNIYGNAIELNIMLLNHILAFAVGILLVAFLAKGDFFSSLSAGLAGLTAIAPAADIYTPQQSILAVVIVVGIAFLISRFLLGRGLDEPANGIFIHAFAGFLGLLVSGLLLDGSALINVNREMITVSILGQAAGACIMFFGLGLMPGLLCAFCLKKLSMLRAPKRLEIIGGDIYWQHSFEVNSKKCIDTDIEEINKERLKRNDGDDISYSA